MKKVKHELKKFEEFLGQEIIVPEYQRTYEWKVELAESLILNLIKSFDDVVIRNDYHKSQGPSQFRTKMKEHVADDSADIFYLGQFVKQKDKKRSPEIVDGQQRISTLIIILKSLADIASLDDKNTILYSSLWVPGTKEPILTSSALDKVFSERIQSSEVLISKRSQKLTTKDKEEQSFTKTTWFRNYVVIYDSIIECHKSLATHYKKISTFCEHFSEFIKQYIWITEVTLEDLSDAVDFFETLNSKSQPLTPADLIKNNFIKECAGDKNAAAANWNSVVDTLSVDSPDLLSKYIRYVYICKYGNVSNANLFEKVLEKKNILDDMKYYMESYRVIMGYTDSNSILNDAQLNFIFNVGPRESLLPIILQIFQSYEEVNNRAKLLDELVTFSYKFFFRNKFKANLYANKVNNICDNISKKIANPLNDLFVVYRDELRRTSGTDTTEYTDDLLYFKEEDAKAARKFAKALYPLIIARWTRIEHDDKEVELKQIVINNLDLEHIYPQNPNDSWPSLKNKDLLWSLGNLIPISSSKNRAAKNSSFKIKFNYYKGKVDSKGCTPTCDEEKNSLSKSLLFENLFVKLMQDADENLIWSDSAIQKRASKLLELMKNEDVLSLKNKKPI